MPLAQVPTSVQAALAFAVLIVPGFLFRTGYYRSRTRGAVEHDLYAVAEAFFWSLVILAATWWWHGREVFEWWEAGELLANERKAFWYLVALLAAPFPVGMVLGWLVNWARRRIGQLRPEADSDSRLAELFYYLDLGGILTLPTVWDQAWDQVQRLGGSRRLRSHQHGQGDHRYR